MISCACSRDYWIKGFLLGYPFINRGVTNNLDSAREWELKTRLFASKR
jgi:hypothetical protein